MSTFVRSALLTLLVTSAACGEDSPSRGDSLDVIASEYVRLVLALGEHDPGYVDAYYGPALWREMVREEALPVDRIARRARRLSKTADTAPAAPDDLLPLRRRFLARQLTALAARADMLDGRRFSFDEETRALYDAVSPRYEESHYRAIHAEIDALLPGTGPLRERVEAFRDEFIIPPARLGAVIDAAVAECRRRTAAHIALPAEERFDLEYVTGKPWGGYNWYQGDSYSLIQINTDLPVYIERAVDLGCHEGYPGHHTYNTLLEANLVKSRGWVEFSVYPLYSPMSLIAEGTAEYGQIVAFPGEERVRFERDVLFPLAGLDQTAADTYYRLQELLTGLSYARNDITRAYLDGEIDREAAVESLMDLQLRDRSRAEKAMEFADRYRGYVINYNLGKDMVAGYVERKAGTGRADARWRVFVDLISSPRLPSDL
jgi:hypothetical protein